LIDGGDFVTAENCPFCSRSEDVIANEMAHVRYDKYPVSDGHMLIIPHRHVSNYFELTPEERIAMFELLEEAKLLLDKERKPDGYNIGINVGEAAGQTVWHVHAHLIPRYTGDLADPKGGVRGVIPAKQKY
jgi:diadenosine tetraphosphate (Ap4A) HIT family hydrolase